MKEFQELAAAAAAVKAATRTAYIDTTGFAFKAMKLVKAAEVFTSVSASQFAVAA